MLRVSWECNCYETRPGDLLMVVGSHERVGAWDPQKALILSTDALSFPLWRTDEIELEEPLTIEYKFIIRRANGHVEWEAFDTNRTAELRASTVTHIQNVWGSISTSSITCFPLIAESGLEEAAASGGESERLREAESASSLHASEFKTVSEAAQSLSASSGSDSSSRQVEVVTASRSSTPCCEGPSPLPSPCVSTAKTEAADEAGGGVVRTALKRSAFILANSGPISEYYIIDRTIGETRSQPCMHAAYVHAASTSVRCICLRRSRHCCC